VAVYFLKSGTTTWKRRIITKAAGNGTWRASYVADDSYRYYASGDGLPSSVATTMVGTIAGWGVDKRYPSFGLTPITAVVPWCYTYDEMTHALQVRVFAWFAGFPDSGELGTATSRVTTTYLEPLAPSYTFRRVVGAGFSVGDLPSPVLVTERC
jgi:hypothetical protein